VNVFTKVDEFFDFYQVFWMVIGRKNRNTDASPTEVNLASELDGKGPPWCIEGLTTTPVGT
jgi:hypothetical protein